MTILVEGSTEKKILLFVNASGFLQQSSAHQKILGRFGKGHAKLLWPIPLRVKQIIYHKQGSSGVALCCSMKVSDLSCLQAKYSVNNANTARGCSQKQSDFHIF